MEVATADDIEAGHRDTFLCAPSSCKRLSAGNGQRAKGLDNSSTADCGATGHLRFNMTQLLPEFPLSERF